LKFKEAFSWLDHYIVITDENGIEKRVLLLDHLVNGKVQNFSIIHSNIIIETPDNLIFIPYSFDGKQITDNLGIK
jgi:hypothetical protein